MSDFIKYPTGKIPKGEFCTVCGKYNARYVTCSALLIHKGKILLVLRNNDPKKGFWAIPGGYIDWDETTENCAKRGLFRQAMTGNSYQIQQLQKYTWTSMLEELLH